MDNNIKTENPFSSTLFAELRLFRKKIEEGRSGLHHFPYTVNKNRAMTYKTVFLLLSALFAGASFYIHQSYFNTACFFFFGACSYPKLVATCLSLSLSICSLLISFATNPISEITKNTARNAMKIAGKIYRRRMMEVSTFHFFRRDEGPNLKNQNRETYEDLLDLIQKEKKQTAMVMKRVDISKTLSDKEKELLLNQSVLELQYKLTCLLEKYETNTLHI